MGVVILLLGLLPAGCADQRRADLPPPILRIGMKPPPPPQVAVVAPPVAPPPAREAYRNVTIVVDPGHGGHDPGTLGNGHSFMPEKSLTLAIATELAQQLRSRGANVVMTRTGDWFLELDSRAAVANRHRADIFVSIHIDASRNTGASGTTVYMCRGGSAQSRQLAQCVAQALQDAGIECRGTRSAGYRVLVASNCPAILVECGFLTNFGDARQLNTPYHRARLAAAIAQGIGNHFGW